MEGKFNFNTLHDYVSKKQYPSEFCKEDKRSLRKRAESVDGELYYTGMNAVSEILS